MIGFNIGTKGKQVVFDGSALNAYKAESVNYITPEMFGAIGDGITDDYNAIQITLDAARDTKKAIKFSNKTYLCSSSLILHDYIMIEGNIVNDEYGKGTIIKNITTDTFKIEYQSNDSLYKNKGVKISGVCFIGSTSTKFINSDNLSYLNWSQIKNCGFLNFYELFNGLKLTGCWLENIFFNKGISIGKVGGSDNFFSNWFVSVDEDNATRALTMLNLDNMDLSKFHNLFLTGGLVVGKGVKKILRLNNSSNNVFDRVYFDYCDEQGVYIENLSSHNLFTACSFRGLARSIATVYDCILLKTDSNYNSFTNNMFPETHLTNETNINSRFFDLQDGVIGNAIVNNAYKLDRLVFRTIPVETNVNEQKISYLNKFLDLELVATVTGNFQTYPQTIGGSGTKTLTFAASGLETNQVIYKAFVRSSGNQLPTGVAISRCRYDGIDILITLKNKTVEPIIVNAQTYFEVYTMY